MDNGHNGDNNGKGKSRDWCWTHYTDEKDWSPKQEPTETYTIYQWEICPSTGRRHAQGFTQFKNPRALGGVKKWLPGAHFEHRKGTAQEASDYCQKPETREDPNAEAFVRGVLKAGDRPGKRTDLDAFKEDVRNGATMEDLLEDHSMVCAKYAPFVQTYRNKHAKRARIDGDLRIWQEWVKTLVESPVHDRAIYWFYDPDGGNGKTWMSKWLIQEKNAFYMNGGKAADIIYAYDHQEVVIFDYCRDHESYVGYGAMESLKNGLMFSSKYQSAMKTNDPPHVLVFANFLLDKSKLSKDRIHVIHFRGDAGIWWQKPNTPIEERIE